MAEREASGKGINMSSNGHVWKTMEKTRRLLESVWHKILAVGREDPRLLIHSLKVGVALALVSLLYLLEPLFDGVGGNVIWVVMTLVLVLEYTAGTTLYGGLNRGLVTLLAGFLIEYIADESGRVFYAVFIGISVFIIGTTATYLRFIPYIKNNYDYVIFLLTFNLIMVSSYRVHNVLRIAHQRLYMIAIGCGLCLLMSLLVFPIWYGEYLHNSTVSKLEGLAKSIEACVNEYFQDTEIEFTRLKLTSKDTIHKCYRAVLNSKSNNENRAPRSVQALLKDPCIRVVGAVAKVLLELANSINKRRHCSQDLLSNHLLEALQDLNAAIKSQPRFFFVSNHGHTNNILSAAAQVKHDKDSITDHLSNDTDKKELRTTLSKIAITSLEFSEVLPFAAFASLLVEMVVRLELVIEQVVELGKMACFKEFDEETDIEIIVSCERKHFDSPHLANEAAE